MTITEIEMLIVLALVSSLILSASIIFRKANGMTVKNSLLYLRTASWMLAGFSVSLVLIKLL